MTRCPYCQFGRIAVDLGSSLTYRCPDCGGTVTTSENTYGRSFIFGPRDCDDLDDFEPNENETKGPQ